MISQPAKAPKKLPSGSDQFNSIQEKLIALLEEFRGRQLGDHPLYFSCCKGTEEDYGTVEYFRDCAMQAGLNTRFTYIEDIGLSPEGRFTDLDDMTIPALFKLYPWEFMFEEAFGSDIPASKTLFIEPAWKGVSGN